MPNSKKDNPDTRIPYEPPRLFDLGGGVAYAQETCEPGGSPGGAICEPGSSASGSFCESGIIAGGKCEQGGTAAGDKCESGGAAGGKCDVGTSPA